MSIPSGTRLGSYEITSQLGEGGMGEVYRARDTKLNRDVAVKVLPEAFTADADRLARFRREAHVLAALNHPNIAAVYGFEDASATHALVMELVEGEDLSAIVARGALPLADALPVARQIADALEAAHEQGIVHRDLKPHNIKVKPDGTVKVLDFGLAKALDPGAGDAVSGANTANSPTLTARATQMGMILGTAAYMAPEQARGKAVDRRADIWAFGVVLYEMLAGRRAFHGEDVSITLACVLKEDVDWSALPVDLPTPVRRLLRRCLEKDPRKRLSAIGDARLELDELESPAPAGAAGAGRARSSRPLVIALATVTALWLLTLAPAVRSWRVTEVPAPTMALALAPPLGEPLLVNVNQPVIALSHDGRLIAYSHGDAGSAIVLRRLDQFGDRRLDGLGPQPRSPSFSPDDKWLMYFSAASNAVGARLMKVALDSAAPFEIAKVSGNLRGASWGPNGRIVFATTDFSTGLLIVSGEGGTPEVLTKPPVKEAELDHKWPVWMPDGRHVVFAVQRPSADGTESGVHDLAVLDVGTRAWRIIRKGASYPQWVPTGHLLFVTEQGAFAAPFDPVAGEFLGEPVRVVEAVSYKRLSGAADIAVSDTGTLVYVLGSSSTNDQLAWVAGDAVTPIPGRLGSIRSASVSPMGTKAAVVVGDGQGVAVIDLERGSLTPVTPSGVNAGPPVWGHDERWVFYPGATEKARGVFRVSAVGATPPEPVIESPPDESLVPVSSTPDGGSLLVIKQTRENAQLWLVRLDGSREMKPLFLEPERIGSAAISPDGRWIAYAVRVGVRVETFLRPFPNVNDDRRPVTTDGGGAPVWSRDSRTLFFSRNQRGEIWKVDVGAGGRLSTPVQVSLASPTNIQTTDRATSTGRVLRIQPADETGAANELRAVFNWFEVLKQKMTEGK